MSNTVVLALLPVSLESHGAPPLLQLGCFFSLRDRNIDSIAYHKPWMNNRARTTHTGGRRDAMQWYETRDETRDETRGAL